MLERLQKFLSRAGVASRRAAERMIMAGRVKVNGRVVHELGTKVDSVEDVVVVDNRRVENPEELIYLVLNKPSGYVSSRRDKYRRKTVYDLLPPAVRQKVWTIGRLDFDTEGLIIFTNDGDLTQKLSHPSFEHEKEYEVVLDKKINGKDKKLLEEGVDIEGYTTAPAKIKVLSGGRTSITIHEGRKRQVRRMFGNLGYAVLKLTRIREQKLSLSKLNLWPGGIKAVEKSDIL